MGGPELPKNDGRASSTGTGASPEIYELTEADILDNASFSDPVVEVIPVEPIDPFEGASLGGGGSLDVGTGTSNGNPARTAPDRAALREQVPATELAERLGTADFARTTRDGQMVPLDPEDPTGGPYILAPGGPDSPVPVRAVALLREQLSSGEIDPQQLIDELGTRPLIYDTPQGRVAHIPLNPDNLVDGPYAIIPLGPSQSGGPSEATQPRGESPLLAAHRLGPDSPPEVVDTLIQMLRDRSGEITTQAGIDEATNILGALQAVGPAARDAIPTLLELAGNNPQAAEWVSGVLSRIGTDSVPELAAALEDSTPAVRQVAARALGMMGEQAREALPQLREVFANSNEYSAVRMDAFRAIRDIDPEGWQTMLPQILEAFRNPEMSQDLGPVLTEIGAPAIPGLLEIARDGRPTGFVQNLKFKVMGDVDSESKTEVRYNAIRALMFMGAEAAEFVPEIQECCGWGDDPRIATATRFAVDSLNRWR